MDHILKRIESTSSETLQHLLTDALQRAVTGVGNEPYVKKQMTLAEAAYEELKKRGLK